MLHLDIRKLTKQLGRLFVQGHELGRLDPVAAVDLFDDEPQLRRDLESWQADLATVKADSEGAWAQVPAAAQNAYLRVRVHPPVAEVDRNQCLACHVTVTSSGMQILRKGDGIVQCENCGRILVMA